MTIKLVNVYDNTVRIVESKSADIPLLLLINGPAHLINDNCYDVSELYLEEIRLNKIKIRDNKNVSWNPLSFPRGSGGPYDYSL